MDKIILLYTWNIVAVKLWQKIIKTNLAPPPHF